MVEGKERTVKPSVWRRQIRGIWPFFLFVLLVYCFIEAYATFLDRYSPQYHFPSVSETVILYVGMFHLINIVFILALWRKKWWGLYGALAIGTGFTLSHLVWGYPTGFILHLMVPIFYFAETHHRFDKTDRLALKALNQ
jgi:hypothetical protein